MIGELEIGGASH